MRNLIRLSGPDKGWVTAQANTERPQDLPVYVNFRLPDVNAPLTNGRSDFPQMAEVYGYLTRGEAVALAAQLIAAAQDGE